MKTKKTGKTMRVAGLLLALVLVTSCFVGGTFAKYATSGTGTDSARVAKFGVEITANGTMFAKKYKTDDPNVVAAIAESVVSSDDKNLVAPGTKGDMVSMTMTGTPEVAVNVKCEATEVKLENWTREDNTFYCPLKFTIKGVEGTAHISGLDYNSAATLQDAIKNEIARYSVNYPANTTLSEKNTAALGVSWEWAFANATGTMANQSDVDDTYLGNQAATATAATVSLTVKTTVTQID